MIGGPGAAHTDVQSLIVKRSGSSKDFLICTEGMFSGQTLAPSVARTQGDYAKQVTGPVQTVRETA